MKGRLVTVVAAILAAANVSWAGQCGNDCKGGPEKCGDCKKGANPFGPYSGSVEREITDLELFGGIGEEKLAFRRTSTSRYKPAIPTPLGTGGSWRHSYYWNIVPNGTDQTSGNEIIHIDYPDGTEYDFHKTTSSDLYLTAVSATEERIEQLSTDSSQYYLWFPDGKRIWFKKVINGNTTTFQVQGSYDKYNNFYGFILDSKNRVTRVAEPGGRYIAVTYGSIGNFPVGNVTFTYYNNTATSISLAGDFNAWQGSSAPMTNSNGTWTKTIPLQLGTSYQYKFVVNGSTWVSDPNNPNTIPAGGPSTGNNSVFQNGDLNTSNSPVQTTFSYTSATATSVAVAGSFNNWSTTANPLTKSGNTWSATFPLSQGQYQYKLVVNGNSWITDPNDPLTSPDGYGGYNSVVGVGPLDEAITQVQSCDGRYVTYNYSAYVVGPAVYSTLTQVNYATANPVEAAHYTYSNPTIGSRPTLATADDARYKGPLTRIAYSYQSNGIEGFISTESSPVDGTVVASLAPSTTNDRSVTTAGRTLQATFAQGNLATETDSLNRTKSYFYYNSGWGMLASSTDANNNTTSYTLTPQFGNIATLTLPDGKTRVTTYTDNNKPFFPATETDENGKVTSYTRDSNNRPTRIDYPDGSYETFTYDNNNFGLLTSHRPRNGYTESYTYYAINEPGGKPGDVKIKTNAAGETTTYTYYASGQIETAKDGLNNITAYQYFDRGLIKQITYADSSARSFGADAYGNRTSITNEIGKTTSYSFDQYNRVTDVTDPLSHNTHYVYGAPSSGGCASCNFDNHPTSITLPSGKATTISYDSEWQKSSVTAGSGTEAASTGYAYDNNGNVTTVTDPRGKTWSYEFDNRDRRKKATDPNGNYTSWTFDGVGNKLTEKRLGEANSIVYAYDGSSHLTDVTDQAGNHTHMSYDGAGNMVTMTDARNNTYTSTYDGVNRTLTMVYPDATSDKEQWDYDAAGNLAHYTTRGGQLESFTYNNRNRETNAVWSNNSAPAVAKTYDAAGRLLTLISSVSTLSYVYDDANQLTSETQQIMADGGPKTVTYTYDADGNPATIGYPSGSSASLTYSSRNQVASMSSSGITASYNYDKNGNRTAKALGNGTSASYAYDDANRVLTVDNQKSGVSFAKYDYAYNNLNDRTSRTEIANGTSKLDSYGYDAIDQVTQIKYNYNAGSNTQDRLVGYNYDSAGNRSGSSGVTDSVNGNSNYVANNLNQYTTAGSLTPGYDGNGNLSSQDGWTYTYDALNRMTSASAAGTNIAFAYDGRNRCVSRTINGVVSFFYYDNWNLLEEQDTSGTLLARYVQGPSVDDLVARVVGSATYYHHQDALGSTVVLTDLSGNAAEQYTYDVFGAPTFKDGSGNTVSSSASANRFLFTGREYIQPAALYDYRTRTYSPALGRFSQTDSMRFDAGDVNLYRYVTNTATLKVDPYGLMRWYITWWSCRVTYTFRDKCCGRAVNGFGTGQTLKEAKDNAEQNATNAMPKDKRCKDPDYSKSCEDHMKIWWDGLPA